MSGYASDFLNSTITLQQEETLKRPVIVKDCRQHHEIQFLPMQNNFYILENTANITLGRKPLLDKAGKSLV